MRSLLDPVATMPWDWNHFLSSGTLILSNSPTASRAATSSTDVVRRNKPILDGLRVSPSGKMKLFPGGVDAVDACRANFSLAKKEPCLEKIVDFDDAPRFNPCVRMARWGASMSGIVAMESCFGTTVVIDDALRFNP